MNLVDVVEIKEACCGGDMKNLEAEEVRKLEADLRLEVCICSALLRRMPDILRALRLDTSQIEDLERPRRELGDLLKKTERRQTELQKT